MAKKLPTWLKPSEYKKLLDLELAERDRAMLILFLTGGLRSNELRSLNVEDLDLEEGTIFIRHGKQKKQRLVPLVPEAAMAIRAHLNGQRSGSLFRSRRGRLSNRGVRYLVQVWGERAGLQFHLHPHALRHTFAVAMLESGADLRTIQEFLGHESIETTAIYLHCTTLRLRQAAERLSAQMFSRQQCG